MQDAIAECEAGSQSRGCGSFESFDFNRPLL